MVDQNNIPHEDYDKLVLLNKELQEKINKLEEKLKKYTSPTRNKKYYEAHKEKIKEMCKKNIPSTEKKKEYNKRYYIKKKQDNQEKNDIQK